MDHYDVIIVGGGPAGSTAGYVLAKAGKKVLIIDKEKFPRKKLCGGMVTEKLIQLLENLHGGEDLNKIIDSSHKTFGIYHVKLGKVCVYTHETRKTHFVHREIFDDYLLNQAKIIGCELKDNLKIDYVKKVATDKYELKTQSDEIFHCSYVIGADGANSVVRKYIMDGFDKANYTIAIEADVAYEDLKCFEKDKAIFPQIYFGIVEHGYGWIFPKKDFAVVGIGGAVKKNEENLNHIMDNFLKFLLKDDVNSNKYATSGFPVPFHNYLKNPKKDNVFLVGDAAGLVEPITGEGMYFAALSGRLAAESILGQHDGQSYESLIYKNIGRFLRQGYVVKKIFFSKSILRISMKKMKQNAKYCKYYFDILAGEIDYLGYIKAIIKDRKKYYSE